MPPADETGLDQLDPDVTPARDATHFRNIVAARKRIAAAEAGLRQAVQAARDAGDSWTVIGAALDTTRQNAYQRFGKACVSTGQDACDPAGAGPSLNLPFLEY